MKLSNIGKFFLIGKRDLILAILAPTLLLTFIPIFTYLYFAKDLQSKEGIMNRNDTGMVLMDRHEKPFFTFYQAKYKSFVPLSQIPKTTQHAVIAMEDKDFYYHPGFSIKSIIRSAISNLQEGEVAYGGSTITQQLVKNSLLTPRKDFLRKYQEIVLAQEIDRKYTKDEVIEMYLNSVYFGSGAFGVEEAANTYFDKQAKDLNLSESSLLSAMLPEPSRLANDEDDLKVRQKIVLQKMAEQGYVTKPEADAASKDMVNFSSKENGFNTLAPHFALMVRDELIQKYGEEEVTRSGMRVKTTLDLSWQEFAEKAVADQVKKLAPNKVSNGAAVALDPKTGEIKALVGSFDWYDDSFGKFNVTTSVRQPGSSFKPIVYVAGLEKRAITPATILKDQPTTYNIPGSAPYKPKNYDNRFRGNVTVRRALSNSLNVASVEVMNKVSVVTAVEMAQKLGISTIDDPNKYGLSLVLGAGEVRLLDLTSAYGVFANNGEKNDPTTILEISDKFGKKIYSHNVSPTKVIDPRSSFQISSILSDNNARREVFGNALDISRQAAVKTGTTEDYRDSLTLGYTPSLVIGVWVGNNDNSPMDNIAGSLGAAPIWKALMEKFLSGTPVEKFQPPQGLLAISICSNGLRLKEASPGAKLEYFLPGTEPKGFCGTIPNPSPSGTSKKEEKKDDKKDDKD